MIHMINDVLNNSRADRLKELFEMAVYLKKFCFPDFLQLSSNSLKSSI